MSLELLDKLESKIKDTLENVEYLKIENEELKTGYQNIKLENASKIKDTLENLEYLKIENEDLKKGYEKLKQENEEMRKGFEQYFSRINQLVEQLNDANKFAEKEDSSYATH